MSYTVYTAPVTEPLTVAEVMRHCRIDQSTMELAPGAPTVSLASPAAPGNVTAGAHRYRVTFVTADGETEGGTVSDSVTVANAAVNGKIELTAIPVGGALVTSRKIYRTAAGGSTYMLLATLADNTTTVYTDNIADGSLGVGAPTSNTTSDPYLQALIKTARVSAEGITRRVLITQTIDRVLDAFPAGDIYLAKTPLQSVTSISYVDENGDTQVLDSNLYQVDTKSAPARISPAFGEEWPTTRCVLNAVTIRFVAGYGAASAVPEGIKLWMLTRIKDHFELRNQLVVGAGVIVSEFPRSHVDGLLDDFVVQSYAWAV